MPLIHKEQPVRKVDFTGDYPLKVPALTDRLPRPEWQRQMDTWWFDFRTVLMRHKDELELEINSIRNDLDSFIVTVNTRFDSLTGVVAGAGLYYNPVGTLNIGGSARITVYDDYLDLAASGATAGTYGSASQVAQVTVDAYGRVTTASNIAITIPSTVITGVLTVPNGGTGVDTITGIIQGTGTTPFVGITGTANYYPKWSAAAPYLTPTSLVYDDGAKVGIGSNAVTLSANTAFSVLSLGSNLAKLVTVTNAFAGTISQPVNALETTLTLQGSNAFAFAQGLRMVVKNENTSTANILEGGYFFSSNSLAASRANSIIGVRIEANTSSTAGTIAAIEGIRTTVYALAAGGTVTDAYGLRIGGITNSGTITNTFGVWIGDITGGTQTNVPYSFYASDTNARNYFGGNTGMGGGLSVGDGGTTMTLGVVNATVGYRVAGLAASGNFLRGDGTNFISGTIAFTDVTGLAVGTPNYVPKWSAAPPYLTATSLIYDTGTLVGIGTITPATELTVSSTSASDPRGIMSAQYSTDAVGARFHFRKARGTEALPTTIVTADVLGRIRFSGYDGANYLQMGSIDVGSSGTVAATRVPTYMAFSVGTDAAPSVLTERVRIINSGFVGIGIVAPTSRLHVPWITGDAVATALFGSPNASNNQIAIQANSSSTSAINAVSASGFALSALSNTNHAAQFQRVDTAITNAVIDVVSLRARTTGTPAANFGGGLKFISQSTTGGQDNLDQARIQSIWTDATHATRTSALQFQTVNSAAALATRMSLSGVGGLSIGDGTTTTAIGVINAVTGYRIGSAAAASGTYLAGNGTNFVSTAFPAGIATPVSIANGGTNNTTFNTNSVIFFDGTKLADDGNFFTYKAGGDRLLQVARWNIFATPTHNYGISLSNPVVSTAGAGNQQWSPPLLWAGSGWKTDAVAASQNVEFMAYLETYEGTAAPTGSLVFRSSVNLGAFGSPITLTSLGGITTVGTVAVTSTSANAFEARITGDAAQRFKVTNSGALQWGDGTASHDVSMVRTSAGLASLSGAFNATVGFRQNSVATLASYLRGDGTNIILSALLAADLSGTVPISKGGTGASTSAANSVAYVNSANTALVLTNPDFYYTDALDVLSIGTLSIGLWTGLNLFNYNAAPAATDLVQMSFSMQSTGLLQTQAANIVVAKEQNWTGAAFDPTHDGSFSIQTTLDGTLGNAIQMRASGSVVAGKNSTLTSRTDDFLYITSSAGLPSGVPTAFGARVPITIDTTNHAFYYYETGAWRTISAGGTVATGGTGKTSYTDKSVIFYNAATGFLDEDPGLFTYDIATRQLQVRRDNILITQSDTYGLLLANETAATSASANQQWSPPVIWAGQGWKTDATAASQRAEFRAYVAPVIGAASPTAYWVLESSIANATYVESIRADSSGFVRILKDAIGDPAANLDSALGLQLTNNTLAALGAQQQSPALTLTGAGWRTTGSASAAISFRQTVIPVQGVATNGGYWRMDGKVFGSNYTSSVSMTLNHLGGGGIGLLPADAAAIAFGVWSAQVGYRIGNSTPTVGHFLRSNGTNFIDGVITAADVSGLAHNLLSATHSDTTAAACVRGAVIVGTAAPVWARVLVDTNNRILVYNGTDTVWGRVDLSLASNVGTSVLPIANGGTNASSFNGTSTILDLAYFNGTSLVSADTARIENTGGSIRMLMNMSSSIGATAIYNAHVTSGFSTAFYALQSSDANNPYFAIAVQNGADIQLISAAAAGTAYPVSVVVGGVTALKCYSTGSVVCGNNTTTTSRTDDFLYITSSAGAPSGVPTAFGTRVPITIDTTNHAIYCYETGAWRMASTVGPIASSTTQTGNTALVETDLFSGSVAAGTVSLNGSTIEFNSAGSFATSISTDKRVRVYWSGVLIFDSGVLAITSLSYWTLTGTVIRVDATNFKAGVSLSTSSGTLSAYASYVTGASTWANANTLKITGQGTNASDVVGEYWKVNFLP